MSGVAIFDQPDFEADTGTEYKTAIDNSIQVMGELAAQFAPHEQDTPDMTVRVDAGRLWVSGAVVLVVAQSTGTITAPSANPRIDRVVIDAETGAVAVITGVEGAVPTAPAITVGKLPVCQVLLDNSPATAAITNDLITDERVMGSGIDRSLPVNAAVLGNSTFVPGTDLGYGTWAALGKIWTPADLLLHFDGSGANFVDSSPHGHVITANGGATQSATQSKFGGKALYCDGTGDYLTVPNNDCFNFGTGDFTVEFWVRMDDVNATGCFFLEYTSHVFGINWHTSGWINVRVGTGIDFTFAWSPLSNTWYHLAVCRSGTVLKVFVDGTQIGSTQTSSGDVTSTGLLYIGQYFEGGNLLKGYMDELLIIKGIGTRKANFTSPTQGFPDIYQWLRTA